MKRFDWFRDLRIVFLIGALVLAIQGARLVTYLPVPGANLLAILVAIATIVLAAYLFRNTKIGPLTEEQKQEARAAQEGRGLGLAVMLGLYAMAIALIVVVALLAKASGKDVDLFDNEPTATAR